MSDWKVKEKTGGDPDLLGTMVNFGTGLAFVDILTGNDPVLHDRNTYVIENEETGEERTVKAYSADELGKRISRGEFDDD